MRLCVFPNDPMRAYLAKGEVKQRYFNPGELFDEVHVISLADDDVEPAAVQETAGRAKLFIHPVGAIGLSVLPRLSRYRDRVLALLEELRPDVTRAYNPLFPGWLAVSCARVLAIPSVVSLHGNFDQDVRELYWREGRLLHWLKYAPFAWTSEPYVLRHADHVICAYRFPVEYARRHGAKNLTVIYNRVDLERFAPVPRAERTGELTVLSVGRRDPEKNHACLIRALDGLDGVRLRIIGAGKEAARLRRLAERLGLSRRVEFIGAIPHRDIHAEYQRADAFAIATRYGGVHIPVLEAMASGLPLVLPRPWWEPEPELAAPAALVVENTPAEFRQAFRCLRDQPGLRQRLGRLARERIEPLGAGEMETRERRVYDTLLGAGRSSGIPAEPAAAEV